MSSRQLRRKPTRRHSRSRTDDVEAAERRDTTIRRLLQRVGVPDVDDGADDPAACFADESRGLIQIFRRRWRYYDSVDRSTDVQGDHVGTLLGEPHRLGSSDSPGGAGDQRDFSREPTGHVVFCVSPASTTS
jgi:hypothetical protein